MEDNDTSDSVSIESPDILQNLGTQEKYVLNDNLSQYSQPPIFQLTQQNYNEPVFNRQSENTMVATIDTDQFSIGNLPVSGSQSSALPPNPLGGTNSTPWPDRQPQTTKYKTTIEMLEDLDSQLPEYSTIKRSKIDSVSQVTSFARSNPPASMYANNNNTKVGIATQSNKDIISNILKKLPWLSLSVNSIAQNLSQHEVKTLLRAKNLDVSLGVKKTAMCESLLKVLREGRFEEEMRLIEASAAGAGFVSPSLSAVLATLGDRVSNAAPKSDWTNDIGHDIGHVEGDELAHMSSKAALPDPAPSPSTAFNSTTHAKAGSSGMKMMMMSSDFRLESHRSPVPSAPQCHISDDFVNESNWAISTKKFSMPNLSGTAVQKRTPSLVYFRDQDKPLGSCAFAPVGALTSVSADDGVAADPAARSKWKSIDSKGTWRLLAVVFVCFCVVF